MRRRYITPDARQAPADCLISALLVERLGSHEHVQVWNRGGHAGVLVLGLGDSAMLAALHGLVRAEEA
jgi:hypothetical protein